MEWNLVGFLMASVILLTVTADPQWSDWYNSDRPAYGGGVDDESLHRVSLMFSLPCSVSAVSHVQCRPAGSTDQSTWFTHQSFYNYNVLHVPCNASGLVCRNEDQLSDKTKACADYEIRVLCEDDNDSSTGGGRRPEHEGLGTNGGFIAMAAGGSVVLPLVCVLIIQLRKSKREERRRLENAQHAAEDLARAEEAARQADAPPAYEELFGNSGETVSVVSTSSLDSGLGADHHRRGSEERLVSGAGERAGVHGRTAGLSSPSSSSLSSTSSSSSSSSPLAADLPAVSALTAHYPPPISASGASAASSSSSSSDARRTSTASSDSASSDSSTDALLPSTISDGHVIHHDPPPAYDWPGHSRTSHVTVVLPAGSDAALEMSPPPPSSSSPSSRPPTSGRRFLGMHLSIFDLMAVIYPDPTPTPPPSYDDALKILALPTQPQVQVT